MTAPVSRRAVSMALMGGALAACAPSSDAPADPPATVPAPPAAFPLRRTQGKRYLEDAAGRPFFLHGDTAWALIAQLRREEVDVYLDDRAARGVNAVLVNILEAYNASNAPRNIYGDSPFIGGRMDFRAPNDAYFAHVDYVAQRAAERDMLLLATPAYLGARGVEGGFYQEMKVAGAASLRAYGAWLGRRYAQTNNILWVMGGDYTPPERLLVRAVAKGITEGGSRGLKTAHCAPYVSALEGWGGEAWLDVNTVYSYGDIAEASREEHARPERMPFFMYESYYENSTAYDDMVVVNGARMRQQAYEALLGGAFGHVFGSNPLWWFSGPGPDGATGGDWRAALDSPGARHMQVLRNVFRAMAWERLVPDDDRLVLPAGAGGPSAAVADDGSSALVYAPRGGPLRLDFGRLAGLPLTAAWIDPTNGRRVATQAAPGVRVLAAPGRNAAGDADWLLSITA